MRGRHRFPFARAVSLLTATVLAAGSASCIKNIRKSRGAGVKGPQTFLNGTGTDTRENKLSYRSIPVSEPFIAMTFDDGPVSQNTPRLLDMLAARGIKATFFTVGENAQRYPNIIRRIAAEGHELANHTWTHPWLTRLSDEAAKAELQRSQEALVSISGVKPRMYRPPFGDITLRHEEWIMKEFGYPTILWSVDCGDSKRGSTAASVRANVVRETRPGAIILVHDLHSWSVDAMPGTLDDLLAKGFRFVTMSQLLAMGPKTKVEAAPVAAPAVASVPGVLFSPGSF